MPAPTGDGNDAKSTFSRPAATGDYTNGLLLLPLILLRAAISRGD